MKFTPKLPHTVPESLKIVKPDVGPLVKARTHERKAELLRDEGRRADEGEGPRPHLEFLERWKALEFAVGPTEERAKQREVGPCPRSEDSLGEGLSGNDRRGSEFQCPSLYFSVLFRCIPARPQ